MRITVLIENTALDGFIAEHGLSLFIEHEGHRILLDAGGSETFLDNARKLGVDLNRLDAAVLSHGHYDHAGGFAAFFQVNAHTPVYARPEIGTEYFSSNGIMHYIGVPEPVLANAHRFSCAVENRKIFEDVWLVGHRTSGLELIGKRAGLFKAQGEKLVPDDFRHELSLVFDTAEGYVIFNSCSHGGMMNIVHEVRAALGDKPVRAYVGGLHMKGMKDGQEICTFSEEELDQLCRDIVSENIHHIYTGHCTGSPAYKKLQSRLPDRFTKLTTGMIAEI